MPLPSLGIFQSASMPVIEPMQVDADPQEDVDRQNIVERNFTVDDPNLDLDMHPGITGYTGLMRIDRLLFIAAHAPALRIEALKMAMKYAKQSLNIACYHSIHERLVEAIRSASVLPDAIAGITNQIPILDTTWAEQTAKHASTLLERLDVDLRNYKGNSIKESIRRGFNDIGSHYLNMGDLNNALKCYSRARDYCTSPKHIVNMCLNVIKVCVYLDNWTHVLTYVNKAENSCDLTEKDCDNQNLVIYNKLKCASGLALLATKKYRAAAKSFLLVSVDHCDFPEIICPNSVTIYGSLCALATFNRQELESQLITSSSFKLLLELEPTIREIVFAFYTSQYGKCLKLLEEIRSTALLDLYLSPHVEKLYSQIRSRALVQYFSPYKQADMHKMALAFSCSVTELEDELMPLILSGQIQARIDSQNKILQSRETDHRSLTFSKTIEVGKEYIHRTKALIIRNAVLKNNLSVQMPAAKDDANAAR